MENVKLSCKLQVYVAATARAEEAVISFCAKAWDAIEKPAVAPQRVVRLHSLLKLGDKTRCSLISQ